VGAGITILFGPSGAGKSTLLDCMAGLGRLAMRASRLEKKALQDSATGFFFLHEERRIAYLFKVAGFVSAHDRRRKRGLWLAARGPSRAEGRRLFTYWKSSEWRIWRRRKPGEISGGEAQRVALARALAPSPRAVFAR